MKRTIPIFLCLLSLGAGPSTRPTTRPTTLPADQMLTRLLRPGAATAQPLEPVQYPPGLDQTTGRPASQPIAMTALIREGDYVPDRVGRLSKTPDGQFEFTFDSDGKNLQDPPMTILPNLALMRMESALTSASRDLKF